MCVDLDILWLKNPIFSFRMCPDDHCDLFCPCSYWCYIMYSAVDSPHPFLFVDLWMLTSFFLLSAESLSFTPCLLTAGYYSPYYLSEVQSWHVLNKAGRCTHEWRQCRESQFSQIPIFIAGWCHTWRHPLSCRNENIQRFKQPCDINTFVINASTDIPFSTEWADNKSEDAKSIR